MSRRFHPINRLVHLQLLQGMEARCHGLRSILYSGTDLTSEILWKNTLDDCCRNEVKKKARNLFLKFWRDPNHLIRNPYFPSHAFNKMPSVTCVYKFNVVADAIIAHNQHVVSNNNLNLNPNLNLKKQRILFSCLKGVVVFGGISHSVVETIKLFKLPVSLVTSLVLGRDISSRYPSLTFNYLLTERDFLAMTEYFLFMTTVFAFGLFLLQKIINNDCYVHHIIDPFSWKTEAKRFLVQTKEELTNIWQLARISVRERVGVAQLFLLAINNR